MIRWACACPLCRGIITGLDKIHGPGQHRKAVGTVGCAEAGPIKQANHANLKAVSGNVASVNQSTPWQTMTA